MNLSNNPATFSPNAGREHIYITARALRYIPYTNVLLEEAVKIFHSKSTKEERYMENMHRKHNPYKTCKSIRTLHYHHNPPAILLHYWT